jgi:Flp pilus assembly protein TadG
MMRGLAQRLRSFRRDQSGVSAIEFAFIAPVMILFYFGMTEYTQAVIAQRKAINTASAIGDLVAQANGSITATALDDIMDIKDVLMMPFPVSGTQLKICIVSIVNNGTANKVTWRRQQNDTTCPAVNATITSVPTELISTNESVIMSKISYTYASPVGQMIKTAPTFNKTYYLRPRRSSQITCATC